MWAGTAHPSERPRTAPTRPRHPATPPLATRAFVTDPTFTAAGRRHAPCCRWFQTPPAPLRGGGHAAATPCAHARAVLPSNARPVHICAGTARAETQPATPPQSNANSRIPRHGLGGSDAISSLRQRTRGCRRAEKGGMLMTRIAKASDEEEQVESSSGAVCGRGRPCVPAQMWQGGYSW